jgi:transcriptional regulator with XRE-family HTH domain
MSYFGDALDELLKKANMTGADLARATGISTGAISKWRTGEQTYISEEDLTTVSTALTQGKRDHAELLLAHLKDECIGPAKQLIEINIKGSEKSWSLQEEPPSYGPKLPKKIEHDFEVLRSNVMKNKHLRDSLRAFASLCEHGRVIDEPDV